MPRDNAIEYFFTVHKPNEPSSKGRCIKDSFVPNVNCVGND